MPGSDFFLREDFVCEEEKTDSKRLDWHDSMVFKNFPLSFSLRYNRRKKKFLSLHLLLLFFNMGPM